MKIRLRGQLEKPSVADGCFDPESLSIHEGDNAQADLIQSLRSAMAAADKCLAVKFQNKENVDELVKARAWVVDHLIVNAWDNLIPEDEDVTLIAVGGFGRGELHPHSDVDLLILLSQPKPGQLLTGAIEAFVTVLWDAGFYLGHSVRTIDTCVSEAKDISTATSLMEARFLSGNYQRFVEMLAATSTEKVWSASEFFNAKFEEQVQRHLQYHDTAYNLEPNIKEGPGGLRDIQMIGWVAKRHFSTQSLHTLVDRGFLTETELQELKDGRTFLWAIRFALHLLTGRGEDRLLFEYQRQVAEHFADDPELINAEHSNELIEQFMQRYYRIVMQLERLSETLLQLFREELLPGEVIESEKLGKDFQITHGYLEAVDDNIFKRNPVALIELFVLMARHKQLKGVRASTIRLIRDNLHRIDDEFRSSSIAWQVFFELVCEPNGIYSELQRMNRYGVLAAFIPAFGDVTGRMQFDLFHVYTVDQHILFVVRNLRRFAYGKYRADFVHAEGVFQQIDHPEVLYLAALFHDIAKGRDGDHSVLGAKDALSFCRQLPLSDEHAERVAWLVEQHLVMSQTAQRRDISDPETIRVFCEIVSDQTRLDYLYLLTIADISATSPKLWNNWKDSLLWDLYSITSEALAEGGATITDRLQHFAETREQVFEKLPLTAAESITLNQFWDNLPRSAFLRFSRDQLEWSSKMVLSAPEDNRVVVEVREIADQKYSELLVFSSDYDGLFAAVTSVIDEIGLDVLSARVMITKDGQFFEFFELMDAHSNALNDIDAARVRRRMTEVLENAEVPAPVIRRLPRRLRPFQRLTRVRFSAARGGRMTTMDVECADRPGLLSQISLVLVKCGVRIHDARIVTMGDRVEDAFIISDQNDAPLSRESRTKLKKILIETLEP